MAVTDQRGQRWGSGCGEHERIIFLKAILFWCSINEMKLFRRIFLGVK